MYPRIRLFFTTLLWIITIAIIIHLLSASTENRTEFENTVGLMFAALGIAIGGTFFILLFPEMIREDNELTAAKLGLTKAKRAGGSQQDGQLPLLLELMDDDERAAFKERLQQRLLDNLGDNEGELSKTGETLEALLAEDDSVGRLRGER